MGKNPNKFSFYLYFSVETNWVLYCQVRERLYGLVCPATDCIVTADQVIETIANTKYGR